MTNDEAIQRLKEGAPFSALWDKQWEEALSMAIEALENEDRLVEDLQNFLELYRKKKAEVEALKQTQWIPCSERLPEPYEDVIISAKGYVCEVCEANLRESKEYFITHNTRIFIKTEEVDAWMPLPKPMKGEQNEI